MINNNHYSSNKVNFIEYLEVVFEAMGRDGPECNDAITEGIAALEMLVDDASEWGNLQGKVWPNNSYSMIESSSYIQNQNDNQELILITSSRIL